MPDLRFVELAAPFDRKGRRNLAVLEGGNGCFEVTRIGETVRTDRAATGQFEFLAVVFAYKTPARTFEHFHTIDQPARDDGDFLRFQINDAQFCCKAKAAFLWHNQQLAVGREEIGVLHRLRHQIDMRCHADLCIHITCGGHRAHTGEPRQTLLRLDRIPAILTKADHVRIDVRRGFPIGQVDLGVAGGMLHARADAVGPRPLRRVRGEGGSGKLFAIEAIVAFLRAVHALGQRAGQGFGFKVVRKPRHVAFGRADI